MRGERAFSRLDLLLFSGSGVVPGPFQRLYIQIGSNFEVEVRKTSPPKKRSSFFRGFEFQKRCNLFDLKISRYAENAPTLAIGGADTAENEPLKGRDGGFNIFTPNF